MKSQNPLPAVIPGLIAALLLALAARASHRLLVSWGIRPVGELFIAIVAGLVCSGQARRWPRLGAGLKFCARTLLKAGIVLMGSSLSLGLALQTGARALGIIVSCIVMALAVTLAMGRRLGLHRRLCALVGVGTAICGASAIVTVAPILEADDDEVGYGVAVITFFGALAILLYPLLGRGLGLSDLQYAVWTGVGVHDTAQVMAAGFAFSERAGQLATVVKLARTVLLVPLALALAWREKNGRSSTAALPWFVLGFFAFSALRTAGDVLVNGAWWHQLVTRSAWAARFLVLTAMAGVGLGSRWAGLARLGWKGLAVGWGAALAVGGLGLLLSRWLLA
ncbi:MAG: putative sulfate exporter family transporter [Bacillota bacterium]